jgi:hypothetical protein
MDPSELLLVILLALPISYVSVFIHELGHAAMARAAGFVVTSFGIGTARPFCVIPAGRIRIYFCLARRLPGITFAFLPQIYPAKWRLVAYAAGGIVANGITAALSLALWWSLSWGRVFWVMAALVNCFMALRSLIPFHFKIGNALMRTDGALIVQAIRWGTLMVPGPMYIQSLAAFRGLWLAIGDTQMLRVYLLAAAGAWSQLDEPDRAMALCVEAEALPDPPVPSLRALTSVVRAGIELEAGRLDDGAISLGAAEADYRATGHAIGLFLLSLYRAVARCLSGDAAGAAADLEIFQAEPLAKRHPELFVAVLVTRVRAAIAMSDVGGVERLLSEYEGVARFRRSASLELQVYQSVARFFIARGDPATAEPAYRRAVAAVRELAGMWADPKERSAFLEARSALLSEARQCAETVGKTEEIEQTIATILEAPPSAAEVAMKRGRRLRRIGYRVMLANVVTIFAMLLGTCITPQKAALHFAVFAFTLILFTVVGAFYRLFELVIGRFIPRVRAPGGAVLLILACFPWYCGIIILMVALFGSPP